MVARRWLPGFRVPGFTVVMLGLLVIAVLVLAPTLSSVLEQRQQLADLQASVDRQQQQVDELREQRARWDDPSYIRAQARDRLLYVMPGETSYLVIDDGAPSVAPEDATPISSEVQRTRDDWARSLLASIVTAGLTETPAR